MTSPALTLARLRARRKEIEHVEAQQPMDKRRPYQERAAEIMRLEAREIADQGDTK